MTPKLINLLYKRNKCDIQIDVIGIPANACNKCFYRIIPGKIAKYIDSLIDPIFETETKQIEKVMPSPHIGIQFSPTEMDFFC